MIPDRMVDYSTYQVQRNSTFLKLLGRWNLISVVQTSYTPNGLPIHAQVNANPGDYFDFLGAERLVMRVFGRLSLNSFRLEGENRICIGNLEKTIKILTDESMVLSVKILRGNQVSEQTFNMKRMEE